MYSTIPQFILGFHGCDRTTGEKVLKSNYNILKKSSNSYDWLGSGIYFWENNPDRAFDYATELKQFPVKTKPKVKEPFVVGAVIDLGHCFNLLNAKYLVLLKEGYRLFEEAVNKSNSIMPSNKRIKGNPDKLLRHLDCAVIDFTLKYLEDEENLYFDTVRGLFKEGFDIYPDAGFQEKNHIQVSVRNPNCIKGFFRELKPIRNYSLP